MRKAFKAILLTAVVAAFPFHCIAEDIDLSSMTSTQLQKLREKIDAEIAENHYVGWADENEITDMMTDYFVSVYGVKSYAVSIRQLAVTNDWGKYHAVCSYSFRDTENVQHTGNIAAEYERTGADLTQIYFEVDGNIISDLRGVDAAHPDSVDNPQIADVTNGELLDVTVDSANSIVVIKVKIAPSFSNEATVNQNYFNVEYLVRKYDADKYNQLQYWAVADMTDGTEAKVISFDVSKEVMQQLRNNQVAANQLGALVDNLWIHPSLK